MAPMFTALGRLVTAAPRIVVACWIVVVAAVGVLAMTPVGGDGLFDRVVGGSEPVVPGSDSTRAAEAISEHSTEADTVTMVVTGIDLADPAVGAAVVEVLGPLTAELSEIDGVTGAASPAAFPGGVDDPQAAPFVAAGGDGVAVVATIGTEAPMPSVHDAVERAMRDVDLTALGDGVDSHVMSLQLVTDAINEQIEKDLVTGEAFGLPAALLIMILVFGGFLAASLPVIGAVASIVLGLGALLGLTYATDVESFVVNVVTVLGLGLSIDYGLLVVSRFREEVALMRAADDGARIAKGDPRIAEAVRTTVQTSGRTVVFSAITVAVSVAGLLFMRPDILTIISLGAVAVILLAVVAAATLTPALLMLWGHVLARGSALERIPGIGRAVRAVSDNSTEEGIFSALARRVHRRPWWVMGGVAVVLVVLALPLTHLTLRASTFEMVPEDTDTGLALAEVSASYPALDFGDVLVVADAPAGDVGDLVAEIGAVDGVATVRDPAPLGEEQALVVVDLDTDDPGDATGVAVTEEIRDIQTGYETWVGGRAGSQIDFTDALVDGFPLTALVVAVAVFVLLFLMTGSLLVPLKALVINSLSIAAS
ncbi:MAG: MMPL family transporter, partial [Actinomycetaceae bacterium]